MINENYVEFYTDILEREGALRSVVIGYKITRLNYWIFGIIY